MDGTVTKLKVHKAAVYGTPTVSVTAKLLRDSNLAMCEFIEAAVVGDTIVLRKVGSANVASAKSKDG